MSSGTVAIAADHAGYEPKETFGKELAETGIPVLDLGTRGPESADCPDCADALGAAIGERKAGRLIGVGVANDRLDVFLNTAFEGGGHVRRVAKPA